MTISAATPLLDHLLTPLRPWLDSPLTEDLAIQRPGEAWVRARGSWKHERVTLTLSALEEIAILAGSLRRQDVGAASPLCATELPGGERLQICLPPAVPIGTVALTLRKHGSSIAPLSSLKQRYRVEVWNQWRRRKAGRDLGALLVLYDAGDIEGFLAMAVRRHLNVLLAGPTGSGKTTLATTLLDEIPETERLILIEDTVELNVRNQNTVRLLYSKDELSGASIGPVDLLQASLRMRPDRVILQELRDDAAFVYASAICTGHPGSITTIHGATAEDAIRRLLVLAKSSPGGGALDYTLVDPIDVVVPLHEGDGEFCFGNVWFVADAERRGESLADLLHD